MLLTCCPTADLEGEKSVWPQLLGMNLHDLTMLHCAIKSFKVILIIHQGNTIVYDMKKENNTHSNFMVTQSQICLTFSNSI